MAVFISVARKFAGVEAYDWCSPTVPADSCRRLKTTWLTRLGGPTLWTICRVSVQRKCFPLDEQPVLAGPSASAEGGQGGCRRFMCSPQPLLQQTNADIELGNVVFTPAA